MQIDKLLNDWVRKAIPRILTQCNRDADSVNYGAFDRNYWHYKIRDFPSIILQQGALALAYAIERDEWSNYKVELKELVNASAIFWNKRATKYGAFEEYYPWERGYPPLAFSTLAILKILDKKLINKEVVNTGVSVALEQLQNRFESQALNQQIAGVAALALGRKHFPELVSSENLRKKIKRTLGYQNKEGWFAEYDGPDLGYLSVSIDCLWIAYDATGYEVLLNSASKALDYIYNFMELPIPGAGMHNARNTDYIVLYGITRFLKIKEYKYKAGFIIKRLLEGLGNSFHYLHAIDDRYLCHYIGWSMIAASKNIQEKECEIKEPASQDIYLPSCGYYLLNNVDIDNSAIISLKKGGCLTLWKNGIDPIFFDYGWRFQYKNKMYVTHWWNKDIEIHNNGNKEFKVKANFIPTQEMESTPFKHLILRILSFLLGRKLISRLKSRMIFAPNDVCIGDFERKIEIGIDRLKITDCISGLPDNIQLKRARRSSARHVASADSFHVEDFLFRHSINMIESEEKKYENKSLKILTSYYLKP